MSILRDYHLTSHISTQTWVMMPLNNLRRMLTLMERDLVSSDACESEEKAAALIERELRYPSREAHRSHYIAEERKDKARQAAIALVSWLHVREIRALRKSQPPLK
jgi:hypothetical protein